MRLLLVKYTVQHASQHHCKVSAEDRRPADVCVMALVVGAGKEKQPIAHFCAE